MKHSVFAVLIILSHIVIASDKSPNSLAVHAVPFVSYEDFKRPDNFFTRDESLVRAVLEDDIEEAKYILLDEPTLLNQMAIGVFGFSGLPIHAARSTAMATFLINQGALNNPAATVTLLHEAMEATVPSAVVHLYLDRGITPLCLNALRFTPLMTLALRSDKYANSKDCLEKARLLLEKLNKHEQYALFSVHDLAWGRDVFACLNQIENDSFIDIDGHKNSCIELNNYLNKQYAIIQHHFNIAGYGENHSVIIKRQSEEDTTNPPH